MVLVLPFLPSWVFMFCYLMSFTKQNSRFELINHQVRKRGRNLSWRHIFIFLESRLFLAGRSEHITTYVKADKCFTGLDIFFRQDGICLLEQPTSVVQLNLALDALSKRAFCFGSPKGKTILRTLQVMYFDYDTK